ncbi:CaiB/BaiF CoA transferase family protein [Rufibacter quisquiliarum]|uniref:Crotonobetainyl-CoA:carnitine CoA-transferase CaiB-like acyl-CoA transferase n=1 Tax=Rufibacter quisquiliarum TaxID=1549639 RepID=A0A839GSV7_9BACT|nr:CaiB/BaiF CoA-transferase family protein [Rufibacter quisquiliarum]MBA9078565.1 crotonobetainyl-CoA:carnitine CoA-transferase CaiB-like acyl-CoA transferase [Rufibacter quisquiliarum]
MPQNQGVFHDLLVVELASVLAGPSVGQFFAEMGATVIKIENLRSRGDVTRQWKLSSEDPSQDVSAYFAAANWGKKSVCLDLASAEAKRAVYELVAKADVVLVSFKPGDAEKLGMEYETLSAKNPRLLYGHVTGYGNESKRAGYDAVLQAEAGFMYMNGEKGGGPVKMPVAMIDLMAAHQLKEGLLAALYLREKTGQGQYVEVSLLRAALSSLANQATNYLVAGKAPERMGSEHPNIVPYGTVYTTADGKELVLAVGDDRQFSSLCQVLEEPALAGQEMYKTNKGRVINRVALNVRLSELVNRFEREPLLQALIQQHVPAGAVHTVPEALAQPLGLGQLLAGENGQWQGVRQVAITAEMVARAELSFPPGLGQHTWEVLQEVAGLTSQELARMAGQGQIYPAGSENEN